MMAQMDVRQCRRCDRLYTFSPAHNTRVLCTACAGDDPVTQLRAERRQQAAVARSARRRRPSSAFRNRKEDPDAPSLSDVRLINGRLVYVWEGPSHA